MNKQYKVIDDIVPDKRPQQSDGTQHTTEEKFFQNMNFYDMVRLKSLGCLLVDAAMQKKKNLSCKDKIKVQIKT